MVRFTLILLISFIAMEFVSYLLHRYVYHGFLWIFHKSHHRPPDGPFEWNDIFPFVIACSTILLMAFAVGSPERSDLLAMSIGMTMFGFVYIVIHDLYVHRRMKSLTFKIPYLMNVKKAHMVHHAFGGEPFGLLVFSPRHLKREVTRDDRGELK